MKENVIKAPDQWIITRKGDFARIKDSQIAVDKKLKAIREHLKVPFHGKVRFGGKTEEQIAKERYDKVLEEVNFDYDKLHEWLYKEENKDKVEIVKLEGSDFQEATEAIFNKIKSTKQKWRQILDRKVGWDLQNWHILVNEETGQVIYPSSHIDKEYSKLHEVNRKLIEENWVPMKGVANNKDAILIDRAGEVGNTNKTGNNKYSSVVIFLHGTYGSRGIFEEMEEKLPHTKIIYPYSPTLQYDMWHGADKAPGGQCQGWINITGDAHELMDKDVCPDNPPPKKNFEEADKIIHLDYPQLRRVTNYVNDIIAGEIASGIPPEKIFVVGYSQGSLLTLAVALTSPHKLGGFISLCGLLPRWDKLLVQPSDKNKETPILFVNNSGDLWVPFWTGKKSYDLLKERGYNVEFKTHPGLGHIWKNEDIAEFLNRNLNKKEKGETYPTHASVVGKQILIGLGVVGGTIALFSLLIWLVKRKKSKIN